MSSLRVAAKSKQDFCPYLPDKDEGSLAVPDGWKESGDMKGRLLEGDQVQAHQFALAGLRPKLQ